jgi:hypothetical protein
LRREFSWWGHEVFIMNTKKLSMVVLNNFKPMIPEQFHAIWQKELTLTITI